MSVKLFLVTLAIQFDICIADRARYMAALATPLLMHNEVDAHAQSGDGCAVDP